MSKCSVILLLKSDSQSLCMDFSVTLSWKMVEKCDLKSSVHLWSQKL